MRQHSTDVANEELYPAATILGRAGNSCRIQAHDQPNTHWGIRAMASAQMALSQGAHVSFMIDSFSTAIDIAQAWGVLHRHVCKVAKLSRRHAVSFVLSCVNVEIRHHAMDRSLGEKFGNVRGI